MIGNVSELNIVIEEVYVSKLSKSRNVFNNYLEVKECILYLGYTKWMLIFWNFTSTLKNEVRILL